MRLPCLKNEENLYHQLQSTKTTFISVGHRESLLDYHQWVLELLQDARWQLVSVQDYRLQKAKEVVTNHPETSQLTIDAPTHESQNQPAIGTIEGLSHKEMKTLTNYALTTIRSKATQGKTITTKNGVTYRYNKDQKVLKWVRV